MNKPRITTAKEILDIIEPIPADKFQVHRYGWSPGWSLVENNGKKDNGCSCFLGHIHRHFNPNDPYALGDYNGYGARQLTKKFLKKKHKIYADGSRVNNDKKINGYKEYEIKDRIVHLLKDMVAAGY